MSLLHGRSYLDLNKKKKLYNFDCDYYIINHGATILDKDDNILDNNIIDESVIQNIKKDLNLTISLSYFCCSTLESRVEFEHKDITKIHCKYTTKDTALKINDIINNKYGSIVNSYYVKENTIEVISKKCDKSNSISKIARNEIIDSRDIFTVGDGYSDIPMIKDFNGYCMKNSVNQLKELCKDKVIDSVSNLIKII